MNVVRVDFEKAKAQRTGVFPPGAPVLVQQQSSFPAARRGMDLHIRQLSKGYRDVAALDAVDLDIASGELVALLGPSGSGKTTLLRVIAGLLHADSGQVLFGDTDATRLSLRERNVGFVFQHYALFKHMTVAENIAFGLRSRPRAKRPDKATIRRRVDELLSLIQLAELGARYPEQLSGGQRQRVALARALAIDPTVLLLDEPFGALDAKVRVDLRRWLRRLHEQTGQTTLFVTHDQEEALELADRVVVLREGRIEQVGTPHEIYSAPASEYVFDFIGRANALEGRVDGGRFLAQGQSQAFATDVQAGAARLYVRPHDLAIVPAHEGWSARVVAAHRLADRITLELDVESQPRPLELDFAATPALEIPAVGQAIAVAPLRYRVYSF
jgi:sulfate transport system ATP-binding protein